MKSSAISTASRILCVAGSIALVVSLFVPLWRIDLDAPQYPEGLALLIYPNKLGGDVDIINGLNHYIGMQTLHADNFIEFTVLPYIIGFFALLVLVTAIAGRRRLLYFTFILFVVFGIVAMADFWRWEYNYGHNLDPNAAIIVPGMAYQPPLIGFKQLLNFGAYSMPDKGGWLFVATGMLLMIAFVKEAGWLKRRKAMPAAGIWLVACLLLAGCQSDKPVPIKLHADRCAFCKMTISDAGFAAEQITSKGRVYKFDDLACMTAFIREQHQMKSKALWVASYDEPSKMIDANAAFYVTSEDLKSPMRGNMAAFDTKERAMEFAGKMNGEVIRLQVGEEQ